MKLDTMDLDIPQGLFDLLKDVTIAVLRERPSDLHEFVALHFAKMRDLKRTEEDIKRSSPDSHSVRAPLSPPLSPPVHQLNANNTKHTDPSSNSSVPLYIVVDEDELAAEPDKSTFKPKSRQYNRTGRRSSVSAERFDPESDLNDHTAKVVHPKTTEQRKRLTESVKDILLFRALEQELMREVISAMFERKVTSGEHVIRQGDDGDNFYVIESGVYDVIISKDEGDPGQKVMTFDGKGSFGELALMYNMPRAASVVAATDGTLWAMDRMSFRRIVLMSAFRKRRLYETLLESLPMLRSLDSYERMSLADALVSRTYTPGQTIIREGDKNPDGMYFVERGELRVTITRDGKETEVKRISTGMYFGEMALLDNSPRTASVYAVGAGEGRDVEDDDNVKVAFLERGSFERLLGPCLEVMKRNTQNYKLSN